MDMKTVDAGVIYVPWNAQESVMVRFLRALGSTSCGGKDGARNGGANFHGLLLNRSVGCMAAR